ncbi:Translationally-controlled tumor -like protein, partial [Trichinella nativa]
LFLKLFVCSLSVLFCKMIIYRDLFSGDELCSDTFPMKVVNDVVFEFTGKHVVRKLGEVTLEGANPSAEEFDEGTEEQLESGIDIVLNHQLMEMPMYQDIKIFKDWIKEYMKKLVEKMKSDGESEESISNFKKNMQEYVSSLLKKDRFKELQFFSGPGDNAAEGQLAIVEYRQVSDTEQPIVMLIKQGLTVEKCTSAKEYYFAIVDMNDRLMFELNISKKNDFDSMLLKQLIAHASLDIVDEAAAEQSHMMIKQVEKYNEWNISAFVTSSGVRFLMLHTAKNDEGIKNFFIEIYEIKLNLLLFTNELSFMEENIYLLKLSIDLYVRSVTLRALTVSEKNRFSILDIYWSNVKAYIEEKFKRCKFVLIISNMQRVFPSRNSCENERNLSVQQ